MKSIRKLGEEKDALIRRVLEDGIYSISESGEVVSLRSGRTLSQWTMLSGFKAVTLIVDRRRVHCLVHRMLAIRYLPAPPRYLDVDHLNGEKTDNRIENLTWATRRENIRRDFEAGRSNIGASGERHNNALLTDREATAIRRLAALNKLDNVEIAACFDVSNSTVTAILNGIIRGGN